MSFFKGFKLGFHRFGNIITTIINVVLLSIVYFIGVGITSIVAKLFKKHFLDMKQEGDTYWKNLNIGSRNKEEYYRQF